MSERRHKRKISVTEYKKESIKEKVLRICAIVLIILFPLLLLCSFKVIKQYKRAVVLRFGRVRKDSPAGPGVIWVVPCTDSVIEMDLRMQPLNLPPQQILTKDFVTVAVDAVIYYHVSKPLHCLLKVQSHMNATEMLAVSILRNTVGTYTLTDLLTTRESISEEVRADIEKVTADWGVQIERVEIKDVILPYELQKAMAAEAEGKRIAKAKIIEAEGEIKTAEHLKEASTIMMENPQIMLLRYLQTLNFIASKQQTSIFFPFPIQIPDHNGSNVPTSVNKKMRTSFAFIFTNNNIKMHISDSPGVAVQLPATDPVTPELLSINDSMHPSIIPPDKGGHSCIEKFLVILSTILVVLTFPFSLVCIFMVVRQFERVVILRNGKVYQNRAFGPGLICYLPCIDVVKFTDLRIICYTVPPQECLTKDSLTITVQAVVYYKVYDPLWAIINVANFKLSTKFLAATTLRNAVGTRKLSDLLTNRAAVSEQVLQLMKLLTRGWGIYVVRTEIKDIYLPLQLQKAMAAEAESSRLANAKIIVANSEIESTKSLQKATIMLMDNPLCMQLRYLQSLHMIAGDKTHTIVFPYSAGLFKTLLNDKK